MSNSSFYKAVNYSEGRFFRVTFRKKDGSIRNMVARLGVKKGVKGVKTLGLKYNPVVGNLAIVYSLADKGFRTVNTDEIIELRVKGELIFI